MGSRDWTHGFWVERPAMEEGAGQVWGREEGTPPTRGQGGLGGAREKGAEQGRRGRRGSGAGKTRSGVQGGPVYLSGPQV